jgi:UDPglucose 6-dehydrogenase
MTPDDAEMTTVAIIGTGYVGLATGATLARLGHQVVCADVIESKIAMLRSGVIPIVEAGLEALVQEGISEGRLSFVLGAAAAVPEAEVVFLCLPTPEGADGSADLSFVLGAAAEIAGHLRPGSIVVNKSTVPVGSADLVFRTINRSDVSVVSNPEFLREGSAVQDALNPHRIVVGGDDSVAIAKVVSLFDRLNTPTVITDSASAEMIKYAANAFLAMKVAYVNSIANLCDRVGANVTDVVRGVGYDPRIGPDFLRPGPGWGGSCFPKDVHALMHIADVHHYEFPLLRGVIEANTAQYEAVAAKVSALAGGDLSGLTVGIWGLTFKAGTDDLRNSPALHIIERLLWAGASVQAYDPTVEGNLPGIGVLPSVYDAARGADVLVILTEWPEFAEANFRKVHALMRMPRIVDARNLLDPSSIARLGFLYDSIGRPNCDDPARRDEKATA